MNDGVLVIAVEDAKQAIRDGMTTEEMLRAAMKQAQHFWLSTDEDVRLRGAIGAVLTTIGEGHDDYDDLVASVESLKKANAFLQAAMAGLSVELSDDDVVEPRFPLMQYWRDAQAA